jgi:MFS family permease
MDLGPCKSYLYKSRKNFHGLIETQAGLLLSVRAFFSITLLLVILPLSSYLLTTKFHLSALTKDLFLARISILFLVLGSFIIGLAFNASLMILGLIITTLGTAYTLLVRSLLTSLVEKHHVATLYNTMAVLETSGSIVAGPIMAGTFRWGLEIGGGWVGMPFLCAGVMFAGAAVVIWIVRLEKVEGDLEGSVEREGEQSM